jgi:hypothetical protein
MNNDEIDKIIGSLDAGEWSFSDEREFVENLFVGRFNFFLVVFSLFMTAGFANTFSTFKSLVFYVGALVLFFVWLILYRAYKKHDRIMRIIFGKKTEHPANKLEQILRIEGYKPKYRVSRLMGIYIPCLCISILIMIALAITWGQLN